MAFYMLERADGGVSFMNVIDKTADIETEVSRYTVATGHVVVSVTLVEAPPPDRTFRDAIEKQGAGYGVNMGKARAIHRNRLREMRAPLLAALDVEAMRAIEEGKPTAAIIAKKQALRDVTATAAIEAAKTPEELKAVIPEILLTPAKVDNAATANPGSGKP